MCCGQNRTTVTRQIMQRSTPDRDSAARPATAPTPTVPELPRTESPHRYALGSTAGAANWSSLRVRYLELSPIRVRGPHTGKDYHFSGADPVRLVDARDADALLRTRFFAKADV